ncbi:phosphopantothenoylcysteine decarboxylase [Erysipelothrix rhusiopathiae]|nr:phosphopantothenoylcysteine decarboxylase [Erysipelothrix rhusiopathiae]MDE8268250.1 phosphopantothenoylcysteine decarboxylase [Erysipelothrix rhusiopathiae]MDE8282410.1 phosphopantothenoylcysteine decarboxylase [Erysipelothrix rhusiopathiae]MDE8315111.1 phosphopantothenoylcysteine decarboxylase [Erysipelothrix rhusiopathiae]MDE8323016.1 phosphopantothenoylcysteine decarboxylase [Erysipelothrix rhusiopathiae]
MKTILLGVSGSISAYKSADLANELTKRGYTVHVIMTHSAQAFITPLTLQSLTKNPVHYNVLNEDDPHKIMHIDLVKSADLLLIAPATANIIAKIAHGIADDMLSTTTLAVHGIPRLIAPAMNTYMYENEATSDNLELLRKRGWIEVEPRSSLLACGDYGKGALAEIESILACVDAALEGVTA